MKILTINPGKRTSLQYHTNRDEYLYFPNNRTSEVNLKSVLHGDKHRIENTGKYPMRVIEVSVALFTYTVRESDIVRLEDDYGRVKK